MHSGGKRASSRTFSQTLNICLPLTMARWIALAILSFFHLIHSVLADIPWVVTPFNPSAVPLAVRSPYLSAWLNQPSNGAALNGDWAKFWTGMVSAEAFHLEFLSTAYS